MRKRGGSLSRSLVAVGLLSACSQVPLNVAPIVDMSHANGARSGVALPGAAVATAASADGMYTVQKGDTLFHIAMMFHCGLRDLARWNGLEETTPIQAGQRLRVRDPGLAAPSVAAPSVPAVSVPPAVDADVPAETHPVPLPLAPTVETRSLDSPPAGASAPADTAAPSVDKPAAAAAPAGVAAAGPMAVSPGASGATSSSAPTAAAAGAAASVAGVAPAPTSSWVWPVDGRVLAKFDPVRGKGIDIGAAEDAPVRAVADGEVSYTGSPLDYGNLVILTHGNGLRTVYAHNKSILAKQGQTVSRGQIIATAGKTSVAAPVVHFEVRLKGVPVDPLEYLPVR